MSGLNGIQLRNKLKNFPGFLGVFPSNGMPYPMGERWSFIVNYDPSSKGGSHWIAITRTHGVVNYFDSMGGSPDGDDSILHDQTHFRQWLQIYPRYTVNRIQYQKLTADTCGEWASCFIVSPQLVRIFSHKPDPDIAVKNWWIHYDSDRMEKDGHSLID